MLDSRGKLLSSTYGCGCQPGCCGTPAPTPDAMSRALGHSAADLLAVPEGANLGLGCGNPQAIAALRPGETVLDLGSGAGFDCFLAATQVGATGRVIGVDMTPEMIAKARASARTGGYRNVEFRLGEIENLPVADESRAFIRDWAPGTAVEGYVVSANVMAVKPEAPGGSGR